MHDVNVRLVVIGGIVVGLSVLLAVILFIGFTVSLSAIEAPEKERGSEERAAIP